MTEVDGTVTVDEVEELAADGLRWLLAAARETEGGGLGWTSVPSDDEFAPAFYGGTAGVVPVLLEARRHFDSYGETALRAARSLAATVADVDSLYFGRTGIALALGAVHDELGDSTAKAAADRALHLVRSRFDGTRWGELFELMGGNAGIGLGAAELGDAELAVLALEPCLRTAEKTPAGAQRAHRPDVPSRLHHISHCALGIVAALARAGRAAGRADFVEAALAGAANVGSRGEPARTASWSRTGPAAPPRRGAARQLRVVPRPGRRRPGLPAAAGRNRRPGPGVPRRPLPADRDRLRDSRAAAPRILGQQRPPLRYGRCARLACDRMAEQDHGAGFAHVLVADLAARATRDGDGTRWSSVEHRATPSDLEPRTGWAMGNAGVVRELLRFIRICRGGDPAYAFGRPDQPAVRRAG